MSRIDKLKAKLKPPIPNTKQIKLSTDKRAAVIVQCVNQNCKNRREINAGQIPKGEQPICNKCWMPMIPVGTKVYG